MFHWDASTRSSLRDVAGDAVERGERVGSWTDLANGVTASATLTGYRTLTGPTLEILDGQPVLRFTGSHGLTTAPVSLFATPSSGLTVLAVMRPTEVSNQRFLLMHATGNCSTNFELGVGTGTGGSGKWGLHRGCSHAVVTPTATLTSGARAVVVTRVETSGTDPNQVSFRVNGSAVASSTDVAGWVNPGSYPTAADRLRIGWRDDLGDGTQENSYFHGDVHEILVFDQAVSDARLAEIEQHLASKWQNGAFTPGAPSSVAAAATTTTSAMLSWTPGPERGAPITAYDVTVSVGPTVAATCSLTGVPPATTCTVEGLSPATTYAVSVSATNEFGTGIDATTVFTTATPVEPPAPPATVPAATRDLIDRPVMTAPVTTPQVPPTLAPEPSPTMTPPLPPTVEPVPAGFATGAVNGLPVPVELVQGTADLWTLIGSGFRFDLQLEQVGQPSAPTDGIVQLTSGTRAQTSGEGFLPGSQVEVWLFSEPRLLGRLDVDASGRFTGEVEVPADLDIGVHTLQVNGLTTDGLCRSLSVGVRVIGGVPQPVVATLPSTGADTDAPLISAAVLLMMGLSLMVHRRLRTLVHEVTGGSRQSEGSTNRACFDGARWDTRYRVGSPHPMHG